MRDPMPQPSPAPISKGRIWAEVLIVLGLSFGASAIYSIVAIINRMTRDVALADQTATLNPTLDSREIFDLIYQVLGIAVDLVPVALVCWLLWNVASPHLGRLGIDLRRPWQDAGVGTLLALIIGAGGLIVYLGGRALGITVAVDPAGLESHWWTIPVLLLSAARAGISEEVIMVGYLWTRLSDLGWRTWPTILVSAAIRGTYHLYQGWGSFIGNVLMGIVFGWLYSRTGRLLPLVIAHFLIDAAVFVGYPVVAEVWPGLLGL